MDHDFWRERWASDNIYGFHQSQPNSFLVKHFAVLNLKPSARVFLPLCGKTHDIHWFLGQGYRVAGAELSELAVTQLFDELGVAPEKTQIGALVRYSAHSFDIFQGDIFELSAEALGPIDAIYDRAALVALPPEMRARYAPHMTALSNGSPMLAITFEYDQSALEGPPFSVPEGEVRTLYEPRYQLTMLERADLAGGLKGKCPAIEAVWALRTK